MRNEVWKEIAGLNGEYFISNKYRFKSIKKGHLRHLKIQLQKNGYYKITACVNGKRIDKLLHRELAIAFIPNPNNLAVVHHIDENPSNYKLNNLEWRSFSSNTKAAYESGRMCRVGEKNHMSKLTEDQVLEIFYLDKSYAAISDKYKISEVYVGEIKRGRRWQHLTNGKTATRRILRGSNIGNAILTEKTVIKIANDSGTPLSIAKRHGVARRSVYDIKLGNSWSWLTGIKKVKRR